MNGWQSFTININDIVEAPILDLTDAPSSIDEGQIVYFTPGITNDDN